MIIMVYGGSASGKSSFAEQTALTVCGEGRRYYIATMKAYGEEGRRRVERHVKLRAGKGFQTIECPVSIKDSLAFIPNPAEAVILIECVSNLTANEMFELNLSPQEAAKKVTGQLWTLCHEVKHAIIVTNNLFEDGIEYAEETTAYIGCLGKINRALARMADTLYEVNAGIPCLIPNRPGQGAESEKRMDDCKRRADMRLVIGGAFQGKLEYVTDSLKRRGLSCYVADENSPDALRIPQEARVLVINHLHLIIRKKETEQKARAWLQKIRDLCDASGRKLILISDEVGNGVVPLQKEERDFREHVGRILCDLAQEAETVERLICGIPQVISGSAPA